MALPRSVRRWWDLWRARRDGRRDGLRGVPTAAEVACPPALLGWKRRADESLAALWRTWADEDARLREAARSAEGALDDAQARVRDAEDALRRARERHDEAREALEPSLERPGTQEIGGPTLSPRVYRVAIGAILLAEFPLNAIAFRLFGEAEVLTWVMTASLAVTLVLCAHGLGIFLRTPSPTISERRWIVVLSALPFLTIVAIALIRARYLSAMAEVTGLAALGPVAGSLAFGVINLLVYAGATMLSYLAHGPRARSTKVETDALRVARDELTRAEQELRSAQAQLRARTDAATQAPLALERAIRVARARASERANYHAQLMAAYASANLHARSTPDIPAILRELPEVEVPLALREADLAEVASSNGHLPAPVEVRR